MPPAESDRGARRRGWGSAAGHAPGARGRAAVRVLGPQRRSRSTSSTMRSTRSRPAWRTRSSRPAAAPPRADSGRGHAPASLGPPRGGVRGGPRRGRRRVRPWCGSNRRSCSSTTASTRRFRRSSRPPAGDGSHAVRRAVPQPRARDPRPRPGHRRRRPPLRALRGLPHIQRAAPEGLPVRDPTGGPGGAFDDRFVDLGRLKGNIGAQNYAIPASVDLGAYRSVVVWCKRFGVPFAAAGV